MPLLRHFCFFVVYYVLPRSSYFYTKCKIIPITNTISRYILLKRKEWETMNGPLCEHHGTCLCWVYRENYCSPLPIYLWKIIRNCTQLPLVRKCDGLPWPHVNHCVPRALKVVESGERGRIFSHGPFEFLIKRPSETALESIVAWPQLPLFWNKSNLLQRCLVCYQVRRFFIPNYHHIIDNYLSLCSDSSERNVCSIHSTCTYASERS